MNRRPITRAAVFAAGVLAGCGSDRDEASRATIGKPEVATTQLGNFPPGATYDTGFGRH